MMPHSPHPRPGQGRLLLFVLAGFLVLAAIIAADHFTDTHPVQLTPEERAFLKERSPFVVAYDKEFQPLQFVDDEGRAQGISVDYLRELATAAGLELRYEPMLWSDALAALRNGGADLMMDVTPTPERARALLFSSPIGRHRASLYVADHVLGVSSLEDLRGRRIGVLKDTSAVEAVRRYPDIAIVEYELTAQLAAAILGGEVDAGVGYDYQFRYHVFKNDVEGIKSVGAPMLVEEGCFAVRKTDAVLLDILDKARRAIPDKTRLAIEQRYVSVPTFTPGFRHIFRKYRHWAYAVTFVLLAMGFWNLWLQARVASQMKTLRDREERYRALFEKANDAIILLRMGRTVDLNPKAAALLGRRRTDLLGHRFHKGAPERQPDGEPSETKAQRLLRLAESGKPQTFEWGHLRPDGEPVHLEVGFNTFETPEGTHVLAICRDISQRKAYEQEILHRTAQFEQLFEGSPLAILQVDRHGCVARINASFQALFGFNENDILGVDPVTVLIPPDREASSRNLRKQVETGDTVRFESRRQRKDGKEIEVDVIIHPLLIEGTLSGAFVLYSDISQRKDAEREIRMQREYFRQLFENSPQAIAMVDPDEVVEEVNKGFETLFGYTAKEARGRPLAELIVPGPLHTEHLHVFDTVAGGGTASAETVRRRKDGSTVPVEMLAYPIHTAGERTGGYCIYKDITKRREAEELLIHQAYHDKLTGLPNRAMLLDRIGHAMRRAERDPEHIFALAYLDLDRFKIVNDSLGHAMGDRLIVATAERLQRSLSGEDVICRVGGDEFAVLLEEGVTPESAVAAVYDVQADLRRPVTTAGHEIHTTTSVGLVMGPTGHDKPEEMLRDAEIAMHQAKDLGKDSLAVFQPSMHDRAVHILQLENALRQAIEKNELEVHYQPLVDLATGGHEGFEALVRWRHPERGLVPPDEFIPLAEETRLIIPLGGFVLREACREFMRWRAQYPDSGVRFVSVNLSAHQFTHKGLLDDIADALDSTGMEPEALHLEITESVVMENAHTAQLLLSELRALGARLSIDDFGTGYSSLSYLHSLPVDTLKVDRSFVARMEPGNGHQEIVRTVIQLAHNLGMRVVAEGVEKTGQRDLLRGMGCDSGQGYLWSRPLPAEDVPAYLADPPRED